MLRRYPVLDRFSVLGFFFCTQVSCTRKVSKLVRFLNFSGFLYLGLFLHLKWFFVSLLFRRLLCLHFECSGSKVWAVWCSLGLYFLIRCVMYIYIHPSVGMYTKETFEVFTLETYLNASITKRIQTVWVKKVPKGPVNWNIREQE